MTEKKAVRPENGGEPRCDVGSQSEHPCWRPATEKRWAEDEAPTRLCPEHARRVRLDMQVDDWALALHIIGGWVEEVKSNPAAGQLEPLVLNLRDEARREYASASAKAYAAELVAQQGPPEEGKTALAYEQSEELARLMIRADAFANARTILEDLPEEHGLQERWAAVDALAAAAETASEEIVRYKRELGFER